MRKEVTYSEKIKAIKVLFEEEVAKSDDIKAIDETYFKYHNHTCPGCSKAIQTKDGVIDEYGMFGLILLNENKEKGTAHMYMICLDCTEVCVVSSNQKEPTPQMKLLEQNLDVNIEKAIKH